VPQLGAKPIRTLRRCPSTSSAGDHRLSRIAKDLLLSGVRKSSNRSNGCAAWPAKRSSNSPGNCSTATGGMKRALCACHSGAWTKSACHHWRQRSRVRIGTDSALLTRAAAEICPACRADSSTTAIPRYTRWPRNRTDRDVRRLRQRLQQKLKRISKSARTSGKHALGLRG